MGHSDTAPPSKQTGAELTIHPGVHVVWGPDRFTIAGIVATWDWTESHDGVHRLGVRSQGEWWVHEYEPETGQQDATVPPLDLVLDQLFGTHLLAHLDDREAALIIQLWDCTEAVPADLVNAARILDVDEQVTAADLDPVYPGVARAIRSACADMRMEEIMMPRDYVPDADADLIEFAFSDGSMTVREIVAAWAEAKPVGKAFEEPLLSGASSRIDYALGGDRHIAALRKRHPNQSLAVSLVRWHDGETWTTANPSGLPSSAYLGTVDAGYEPILIELFETDSVMDEALEGIIRRSRSDAQVKGSDVGEEAYQRIHLMWSQFQDHPRPKPLHPLAVQLGEWLDDIAPLAAKDLAELVGIIANAIQDDPKPVDDEFIEALIGPSADTVFALHWINATREPGEDSWQVNDHGWRVNGDWDSDFPEDEPHWVAEGQRLERNPDLVAATLSERGIDEPFELAWDLSTPYRLHAGNEDTILELFDQGKRITKGLAQLAAFDPRADVTPDALETDIVEELRRLAEACEPSGGQENNHWQHLRDWLRGQCVATVGALMHDWAALESVEPERREGDVASAWQGDVEDATKHWRELALELNMETQWAHACSWMLAARIAKSVDECRFYLSVYPTGLGSVLHLQLTKEGRQAELLMNRAGSIRGRGFAGNSINWDDPTILSMPWVWWTSMAPEGRRQVLDEIHRGLGIEPVKGRRSSRQVVGMRLLGQIMASAMGDTERWWTHDTDILRGYFGDEPLPANTPEVDAQPQELVCVFRGEEPRAWVHDGYLWTAGEKIDAYALYRAGDSLAAIAARVSQRP